METGIILSVVGTGVGVGGFIYTVIRNFRKDFHATFERHERRFEMLDQRLFLLALGKSLPDIFNAEREAQLAEKDGG